MNFCVLISSTRQQSNDAFKKAIRETWALELKKNGIDYFFYEGDWDSNTIDGDIIKLNCVDNQKYSLLKFVNAIDTLKKKNLNYDFIFKTTLNTYIDVSTFLKFIDSNGINKRSYIGFVAKAYLLPELALKYESIAKFATKLRFGKRIIYKHGSGFFIGSDLVEQIVHTYKPIEDCQLAQDVFIGLLLAHVKVHEPRMLNKTILSDASHKVLKKQYEMEVDKGLLFHYRLKNDTPEADLETLEAFHNSDFRFKNCTYN